MSDIGRVGESISEYATLLNVVSCIQRRTFELEMLINKNNQALLRGFANHEKQLRDIFQRIDEPVPDNELAQEEAQLQAKKAQEHLLKMEAELKAEITQCLWNFTDRYAAPNRRETYPFCLPIMRAVLNECLDDVKRQGGDFTSD